MPGCGNFIYIPVKTTAQTLMLSAHPAANPEVQGSKHAVELGYDSRFFTDNKDCIHLGVPGTGQRAPSF